MRTLLAITLVFLGALESSGQVAQEKVLDYTPATLRTALMHGTEMQQPRSVPLSLGLSALVPGAGQAYNRDWIKAAVAVSAEVGVLWAWSSFRSRGTSGRDAYQATAHANWSPVRYALWLIDYTTYLNNLPGSAPISSDGIVIDPLLFDTDLSRPDSWTSAQQVAMRRMILGIRAVEAQVYHPETGARFSHQLPFFGEQQYYELIGKYFQFAPGWDDYVFLTRDGLATWIDDEGNFIASIDPEQSGPNGSKPNVSSKFYDYAERHGKANDYLRRASRVTILLFANHLLAAIEAAVSTKIRNNRLRTRVTLLQQQPAMLLQIHI